MRTVKLMAVPSSSTTEPAHASRHHLADHPHSDACRRTANLGLQPELGLCPKRRLGSDRRDPDHPLADGPPLGRVDGFDEDEAQSECDEGSEVLVRFLATERNALEALELADELLDPSAG